jgi:phage terminase large subunit GpA-like protein
MTTMLDMLAGPDVLAEALATRRRRAYIPPPRLTADQWADRYRIVPTQTSAISGPWRTSQIEIARGPMRAISDPAVRRVIIMASAQIMKTSTLEVAIGYHMHLDPCPMLLYSASKDTIDATVTKKIDPMIASTPELSALWGGSKALETKNDKFTKYQKLFPGGDLELLTINSTANLRNRAAKLVMVDEVDDCQKVADGDPISLAEARAISFKGEEKVVLVSTPTIRGSSKIEEAYQKSDMRKPYVQCPACGESEYLKWQNVKFDGEDGKIDPSAARYEMDCGHILTEPDRIRALTTEGSISWRQTKPFRCCDELQHPEQEKIWTEDGLAVCKNCGQLPIPTTQSGFWGWIAYHPRWSLEDIVRDFLDRKGNRGKLQEFINNRLAETWVEDAEDALEIDPTSFAARVEPAWDLVPAAVRVVTVGVDVQPAGKKGGLHVEVVGWGDGEETWSLEYHHIAGDPDSGEVWAELDEIRLRRRDTEDGRSIMAQAVCVDTGGHNTDSVMAYCGQRKAQRVWAIKGGSDAAGTRSPIWPAIPPQTIRHGAKLYILGTQSAKDWIAGCIGKSQPGPGYMHVPSDRTASWFLEMTNERRKTLMVNGRPATQWRPRYDGVDVEALDCRAYAKAALEGLKRLGVRLGVAAPSATAAPPARPAEPEADTPAAPPPALPASKPRIRRAPRTSSFWT